MSYFDSDGIRIHFKDVGSGEPILLIHGFASNIHMNWDYPGWTDLLVKSGRRVVALDNRGHGESEKIHDPGVYGAPMMAEDARRLLDHLGIEKADVMGYSMGARISAFLALNHPERVGHLIFGGLGYGMVEGVGDPEPIAQALEADTIDDIKHQSGRAFRQFADQTKSDRLSLAACMRSSRQKIQPDEVAGILSPVLIAVGTRDAIAGSARDLAALIPNSSVLDIPDRDHMVAVGDKVFKQGVLNFLERSE
ncbi:MAG: alpha/beta hydrolase [Stappiaceae bacterium]